MKAGDRVRMSEGLKTRLRGPCGRLGIHIGPVIDSNCEACSSAHVEEFGDCVGVVQGLTDYGSQRGPEVDVRWQPSNLRYAYAPEELDNADV